MLAKTVKAHRMELHGSVFKSLSGTFSGQLFQVDWYNNPYGKYPLVWGLADDTELQLIKLNHEECEVRTGAVVQAENIKMAQAQEAARAVERAKRRACPWYAGKR